jgi:RNA polymerase sigma factor (TIGR02999 family)
MAAASEGVTQLLIDWSNGNKAALDQLMPLVYDELRRLAKRHMARERRDHTLQTSALINEAYLRLVDQKDLQWQNRAHFFAVAAQVMRHILIDHARRYHYEKRGAGAQKIPLDEAAVFTEQRAAEFVALDDALVTLAGLDPRRSQVVELRFFGGLSIEETAEVLKISPPTVQREWRAAKAWLGRFISNKELAKDPSFC